MIVLCNYCGKEFYKRPSEAKKDKRHFCCLECRNEYFNEKKAEKEKNKRHKSDFVNEFIIKDSYSIMIINSKKYGRKEVLIDTNKIDILSETFWHVAKMYEGYFSVVGWIKNLNKEMTIHRFLTNCPSDKLVDHINRNPLDNRLENLRCVDRGENARNSKVLKTSKSGIKGVRYRYGRYQARITLNGKTISLGHFDTLEEAKKTREDFCKKHNLIS